MDAGAENRSRRSWSRDEKRQIVDETFRSGASVANVARRYGLNANLVFNWRKAAWQNGPVALALISFPPRAIAPSEVELFRKWLGRAGNIPLAYVSERRSDDPRFYRRIVIQIGPAGEQICTVHAPSVGTESKWIVSFLDQPYRAELYDGLRDALNSIRPVLF